MWRAIRFLGHDMFETDCLAISRSAGLLETEETTFCFAVSVKKREAHCVISSTAFMATASRVMRGRIERL